MEIRKGRAREGKTLFDTAGRTKLEEDDPFPANEQTAGLRWGLATGQPVVHKIRVLPLWGSRREFVPLILARTRVPAQKSQCQTYFVPEHPAARGARRQCFTCFRVLLFSRRIRARNHKDPTTDSSESDFHQLSWLVSVAAWSPLDALSVHRPKSGVKLVVVGFVGSKLQAAPKKGA